MPSLLLLANPAASGFTGGLHRDVIGTLRTAYDVDSAWPNSPIDARAMAAEAAVAGIDMVVAFGGDGVVHHVANGLAGSATALGIIPAGTTNVLARIIGVPQKPQTAAEFLAAGPALRAIPIGQLQTSAPSGASDKRIATFAIGAGLDAEVVAVAEQEPYRKYSFGSIHYARTAVSVLWHQFRDRPANLRVTAHGRVADAVAVFVQLHRMYSYFGRLPLQLAGHQEGSLTAMVVSELPTRRAGGIVLRALTTGRVDRVPGIELWNDIDHLALVADPPVSLQADGELLGEVTEALITVDPEALLVAVP